MNNHTFVKFKFNDKQLDNDNDNNIDTVNTVDTDNHNKVNQIIANEVYYYQDDTNNK